MESGNGAASSSTGPLIPVSDSSDVFLNNILAHLQSSYLFEESNHSFRYTSAFLINNPALEDKYNTFRNKRREQGYSEEELKETYGFLLLDELNKAKAIGENGVLTGNGTCSTLGDPSKGVYLSMYSDCLDLNLWYHGKSGYIAVIRLTRGKVKRVPENYTQNLTEPTVGFDCHVSEQLPSVSSKTSSFLAFERTQYYVYELLDDGSNTTAQSPSLACPYAVVAFSYTDNKVTLETQQEKSEEKTLSCPYLPWMGQLQIGSQIYNVGIRSTAGALIHAKLPPAIKAERAISMLNLRKLLPKAAFETCFPGEVIVDGFCCSLCNIVASSLEEKEQLTSLVQEIKDKDIALTITLNDGGFLVLIHGSHFLSHDNDNGINFKKILQGLFVFPESQVIHRVTKVEQMKQVLPTDVLRVLPLLTYAEGEVEKSFVNPNEELQETFVHHMQSYASLISPGLPSSPFREVIIFPDQYDVPDAHKHLYSTPEWTDKQWQSLKSYLSNPASCQLPVCTASEIFASGQEERREDLDDDIYICLSSPEEPATSSSRTGLEDQKCLAYVETSLDKILCAEAQPDSALVPQKLVPTGLQPQEATAKAEKSDTTVLTEGDIKDIKTPLMPPTTDEPSEELILSITSAARTVSDEGVDMIKHNDDQLTMTTKLQVATLNSLNEIVKSKKPLNSSDGNNPVITQCETLHQGQNMGSKACTETPSLQLVQTFVEKEESVLKGHVPEMDMSEHIPRCEMQKNKQELHKLFLKNTKEKTRKIEERAEDTHHTDSTFLKELETCSQRKKSERWDLKPVISECGQVLVPHGSVDIEHIKSLQKKLQSKKDNLTTKELTVDAAVDTCITREIKQELSSTTKTAYDVTKPTEPTDERNLGKSIGHFTVNTERSNQSSISNYKDQLSTEEAKENHLKDTLTSIKCKSKGDIVLRKLKSVILRKKRKKDILNDDLSVNGALDGELSPKRAKDDLPFGMLKSSDTCAQEATVDDQKVTKMLSVDPLFAHALGLTPKGGPDKKTLDPLDLNSLQRKDLSDAQEPDIAKEPPSRQHPPVSPKGARIKTLKKHQNIPAEQVKKKWWLHFQTPACYAEKQYEGCSRDISVRKTIKGKKNTCSSSDALNLLADLALCASNDQVSSHPPQENLRESELSLKKCDLTKDVTSPEHESVLHALLRQPAARPIQPLEPPSPHLVGESELGDVICREHAYSLPPSSSLLLALPAHFQVLPLNGSTRLLHHPQKMWDGFQALQQDLKKQTWCRRKFRLSRTIVNKDLSVQVTRHWKENYDFNLDSRFTVHCSNPKDKAISRALHGPWDFSIPVTNEEVQLIVHMWIGLFYSRSTARFFHLDPDSTFSFSEDNDVLDGMNLSKEKRSEQIHSKTVSSNPSLSVTDNFDSQALDLSKPKNSMDQGSVVLDLSGKSSGVHVSTLNPEVSEKEHNGQNDVLQIVDSFKAPGLQETTNSKCYWNILHSTGSTREMNISSFHANQRTCISSEMNEAFIPLWKGIQNTLIQSENVLKPLKSSLVLSGFYRNEKTLMGLLEGHELGSKKQVTCQTQPSNRFHSVGQNEFKESKTMQVQENPLNKDTTRANKNPTAREIDPVSSKHVLEIKRKYLEKLKAASSGLADLVMDCSTPQKHKEDDERFEKHLQEDAENPSESRLNAGPELQSNTLCSNGIVLTNKNALSDKPVVASLDRKAICVETTAGQKSESDICLAPLVIAENMNTGSEGISVGVSSTEAKDHAAGQCETRDGLPDCAVPDIKINQEPMVENTAPEATDCCSMSQDEGRKIFEEQMTAKTTVPKEDVEKTYSGIVIPFIGMDMSVEYMLQPQTSDAKGKNDDVGDTKVMPLITGSTSTEVITTKEVKNAENNKHSQHAEPPVGKLSPPDQSEISHPSGCRESEPDDRCPTPTIDEKPYVYTTHSDLNSRKHALNKIALKEQSRKSTPVMDEPLVEPESTTLNSASVSDYSVQSDIDLRTLRTLQSLDEFLSTLQYKSSPFDSTNNNPTLSSNNNSIFTNTPPTQISSDFKDKKIITTKPSSAPVYNQQVVQSEPSEYFYISPFKDVLGVMQQPKQRHRVSAYVPTVSPLAKVQDAPLQQQQYYSSKPVCSAEGPVKSNDDKESPKINTAACSTSQCPVMAVRPFKSDDGQGDGVPEDKPIQNSFSDPLQPKPSILLSAKKTISFVNGPMDDNQEPSEDSALDHLASNKCRFTSEKAKPGQQNSYEQQYADSLKAPLSSSSMQSFKTVKSGSKHGDGHDPPTEPLDEKVGIMNNTHFGDEDILNNSTSFVDCKTNKITDYSLGTEGSLICTVSNTKRKRLSTFLEKVSKRCLQDDQTQSSMDQECLIFLDQMKRLIKRSKWDHPGQQTQCDQSNTPFSSPVTVRFSHLKEQNDSFDDIEPTSSFVGQIISVDMSDREVLRNTPQKGNTSKPQPYGPLEHAGVSAVTTECAKLYQSIMNKICSGKRITALPKDFYMTEPGDSTADSSNYFDFCSQMKREMDDSFRSNLNSVVKKSCKKKNRFFLLVTSDDVFFNETKAQLEAEGHVSVHQSDLGESSSSPLLIIIRNEDIAEHIFEVPQLLKLRMSPAVQFAGIDEPDDVINLTYQEVFIKGGFVMFDGGAVESLSPSNMKKVSDILQKLSQRGKWKWVLHYRDSRRLKENARLCADAKEKRHLLSRCQEDGLLDILPYHECDLMSREQPDYLQCLCHLQVQNISARYPVFVTDSATDSAFENTGILTMTVNSFLMDLLSKNIYSVT